MSNDELLAEVRRTNQLLEQLLRRIDGLGRAAGAGAGAAASGGGGAPAGGGGEVADDADLDGQWGNPQVRKDPPRWTGQTCSGLNYSDCPPDYLTTLAGFLEWQASKSDEKNEMTSSGKPRSSFLRKDAARARGWARRNAAKGQRPAARAAARPAPVDEPPMIDEDDVPFLQPPISGRDREAGDLGQFWPTSCALLLYRRAKRGFLDPFLFRFLHPKPAVSGPDPGLPCER